MFLDEAPEFSPRVLQMLREPLESGRVDLVRAGVNWWYPADFQLLMAMNPCPMWKSGQGRSRLYVHTTGNQPVLEKTGRGIAGQDRYAASREPCCD